MKVIICHPGTQHAQQLAKLLYKKGFLLKFYTGISFGQNHFINKLIPFLPKEIGKQISTRIINGLPDEKIKRNFFNEIMAIFKIRKGQDQELTLFIRNKIFQEKILNEELKSANIVIGYDTSSWIIAKKCKQLGVPFILDVSIGHPVTKNEIFKSLSNKYPNWDNHIQIKSKKLIAYERTENDLASFIVTPSSFVKDTYIQNGVDGNKIFVNPFGTNTSYFKFSQKTPKQKIKFLFFGGLTVRKGLPLLLSVWEKGNFKMAELTIAGFGKLPENILLPNNVMNKGKIALEDRERLFEGHDIFIFPSNFEGFAQVQIEAAASGLPLISTLNAGGKEIIKNSFNGLIITPESEDELNYAIQFFIDNKEKIPEMSKNQKEILSYFTWEAYGERWINLLNTMLLN